MCVLHKLIGVAFERNLSKPLLYLAMQTYLSERIFREGEMVGQRMQPTNGILASCSAKNRFGRVVLCNILERVNKTLPAQLPAPVETRQFVDDLTTMVVDNSEDDVANTTCSVAVGLRDSLDNGKLTFSRSKSKIVSKRNGLAKTAQEIPKVSNLHLPVADAARDLGIDAAG